MDIWTATEAAYKNGHADGYKTAIKEFSDELKEKMWQMCWNEGVCMPYPFEFVDKIADKLMENKF